MTGATSPELAYLDFHWRYDISPVAQDICDIRAHFQRRDSLYRLLGIPLAFVAGRSAAEFGSGSDYDTLFTTSLRPARYLLVNGNPRGEVETRANLASVADSASDLEVMESRFEVFETEERFDLLALLRSTAAAAWAEAADVFEGLAPLATMTLFPSLWGRGQQYLSLIRQQDGICPARGAAP